MRAVTSVPDPKEFLGLQDPDPVYRELDPEKNLNFYSFVIS
jgi:hypothetical protein